MKRLTKRIKIAAILFVGGIGFFGLAWFYSYGAAPLPKPAPISFQLPPAAPPTKMAIYQLPTGITHRSAGFAYRGGSFSDRRDFAMSAVLVKHPRGDLLIDTGFGREIDTHIREMPFLFRALTSYERWKSAAEQLDMAGYDRKNLRGILLTHAHWDHVSGIPEFPGVPVMVTAEERAFVNSGGAVTVVARNLSSVDYKIYEFEGPGYLGFPRSHDVYGDGSIVVVPAPGHTPGSVIIFLTIPGGQRYALLGDLVWQREGITEREERPWIWQFLSDVEPSKVRENMLRMAAITARFPEIILVPAHDSRGYAEMPRLPALSH